MPETPRRGMLSVLKLPGGGFIRPVEPYRPGLAFATIVPSNRPVGVSTDVVRANTDLPCGQG
jgi:hypothetical protein